MTSLSYDISTGELVAYGAPDDGGVERAEFITRGYSGKGNCRDNPDCQDRPNQGPIPIGKYRVYETHRPGLAAPVFRLVPDPKNDMRGRSGFLIHGDNPTHDASRGCIILWRSARLVIQELVKASSWGHLTLEVCASRPQGEDLN